MPMSNSRVNSSFRDPSGHLFISDDVLYRQVNQSYSKTYDLLISSGLYADLTEKGFLIPHKETSTPSDDPQTAWKILQPDLVPFISYPYEWCFSELKDAALLTLEINRIALRKGMILKDASAYNIQFVNGKPILIDTLSFDIYRKGSAWDGYRQFCQHFLAPLALSALVDIRLILLSKNYIDGIPLDLASRLLPARTKFGLSGLGLHIHFHARVQQQYADKPDAPSGQVRLTKEAMFKLLDGLTKTILKLEWQPKGTEWGNYYQATNYSDESLRLKGEIVGKYIEKIQPTTAWDLGANNGLFSREASRRGVLTIASDIDPAAVEKNYLTLRNQQEKNLLPLVMDLTNPSPALGWANQERQSFVQRGPVDLVLALALIHHLAISNNLPLGLISDFFASIARWAIVEFIPKNDSQVARLLSTRKDIFPSYTQKGFEEAFKLSFKTVEKAGVHGSERTLYLLERR
ncbi:MAG: SAM-dependent methyltransferase [Chloroflexi bacterium]|nr:SAM-dependent methyltransferase [Chloroflexota bacterium]